MDAGPEPFAGEWRYGVEDPAESQEAEYPESFPLSDGRVVIFATRNDAPSDCPQPAMTEYSHLLLVVGTNGACEKAIGWNSSPGGVDAGIPMETRPVDVMAIGATADEFLFLR